MPGVSSRFSPRASAASILCAESDGVATKKSESGIVRPAGVPAVQEGPRVPVRAAGTRTRYAPPDSNRYGFSRLTGVVSSVVYGGFGNVESSGAPSTPANTWFQTAFVQNATWLLRVSHCCWEPLMVNGSLESAMKPPLAYCGPAVQ